MNKKERKNPRNYDGTATTTHRIGELLPHILDSLRITHNERPDLVIAAWPEIIGQQLASMTQAISFVDGVLVVKVKNSTLHSLLNQHEKARLLANLRKKFPANTIRTIFFRIG